MYKKCSIIINMDRQGLINLTLFTTILLFLVSGLSFKLVSLTPLSLEKIKTEETRKPEVYLEEVQTQATTNPKWHKVWDGKNRSWLQIQKDDYGLDKDVTTINAYSARPAMAAEVGNNTGNIGKTIEALYSGVDAYWRYPFAGEKEKAWDGEPLRNWHKIGNWLVNQKDQYGNSLATGSTAPSTYGTRLATAEEVTDPNKQHLIGRLIEAVFIGEDAYWRYPFVGSAPTNTPIPTPTTCPKKTSLSLSSPKTEADDKITITWTDVDYNDSFNLEIIGGVVGKNIEDLTADSTSFIDFNATNCGTYKYRVSAYKDGCGDNWSDQKSIIQSINKISNLSATLNNNKVTLKWQDNSKIEAAYRIQRSIKENGVWSDWLKKMSIEANSTSWTDNVACTSDSPPEAIKYRVRAQNNNLNCYATFIISDIISCPTLKPTNTPAPLIPTATPTPEPSCGDGVCDPGENYNDDGTVDGVYCFEDCCTTTSAEQGDLNEDCFVNSPDWGIMQSNWSPASMYPIEAQKVASFWQKLFEFLKLFFL